LKHMQEKKSRTRISVCVVFGIQRLLNRTPRLQILEIDLTV